MPAIRVLSSLLVPFIDVIFYFLVSIFFDCFNHLSHPAVREVFTLLLQEDFLRPQLCLCKQKKGASLSRIRGRYSSRPIFTALHWETYIMTNICWLMHCGKWCNCSHFSKYNVEIRSKYNWFTATFQAFLLSAIHCWMPSTELSC